MPKNKHGVTFEFRGLFNLRRMVNFLHPWIQDLTKKVMLARQKNHDAITSCFGPRSDQPVCSIETHLNSIPILQWLQNFRAQLKGYAGYLVVWDGIQGWCKGIDWLVRACRG